MTERVPCRVRPVQRPTAASSHVDGGRAKTLFAVARAALVAFAFAPSCKGERDVPPSSRQASPGPESAAEGPRFGSRLPHERERDVDARPAASALERPLVEAPTPEAESDPPGPAGDLAAEIASFTDLRSCVARHRVADPLFADALEALGYDTFAADACRMIAALKARDPAPCAAAAASSVRARCLAQVAMLVGDESLCPVEERTFGVPSHDPLCLAAARRDARPCAALLGMERASCEGVVAHDPSRCGTDGRCARLVQRWLTALPAAPGKTPYAARITIALRPAEPRDDLAVGAQGGAGPDGAPSPGGEASSRAGAPAAPEPIDLAREASVGAVLVTSKRGVRLAIGDPRPFFVTDESHGGGLVLDLPDLPAAPSAARLPSSSARVTLRHRALGVLELTTASLVDAQFESIAAKPGGVVKLRVAATVGPSRAPWRAEWSVDTWVRDVVALPDGVVLGPHGASSSRPVTPPRASAGAASSAPRRVPGR